MSDQSVFGGIAPRSTSWAVRRGEGAVPSDQDLEEALCSSQKNKGQHPRAPLTGC